MIRRLSLAGLGVIAALAFCAPAEAASIMMCKAPAPGTGSSGPGRITMQGTGNVYQIDRWGCAVNGFLSTDVGEATANGFAQLGALRSIVLSGATAATQIGVLPPAGYILGVIIENESSTTFSAVNNAGLKVGSTSGGTDIVNNMALSSFLRGTATDVSLAKRAFSATQATNLFIDAGSWSSGKVIVTILYTFF